MKNQNHYFSGEKLIGDDFSKEKIIRWFKEEEQAYSNLRLSKKEKYEYEYKKLNEICGFRLLSKLSSSKNTICGFGSAFGDEIFSIKDQFSNVILIDSADDFKANPKIKGSKVISANPLGDINLKTNSVSVFTCLGVLHHIPNVSHVMSEFSRCLEHDGILILREPVSSLGDWRKKRKGVTKNERGIPQKILLDMVENSGFEIVKRTSCMFPPVSILAKKIGMKPYNSAFFVYLDIFLSFLFRWNYTYHRTNFFRKFCHSSEYLLCVKKA